MQRAARRVVVRAAKAPAALGAYSQAVLVQVATSPPALAGLDVFSTITILGLPPVVTLFIAMILGRKDPVYGRAGTSHIM